MSGGNVVRDEVFDFHGQFGLSSPDLGLVIQVEGLLAKRRRLAVELVARNVALLLLVRRRVESLRHMAGLADFALLGRLAAFPVADGFGRRDARRRDGMAAQAEVRLFKNVHKLGIVRFALEEILVAAEHGPTRLQFNGRTPLYVRLHGLDKVALDATDA